ncbi:MFS transporter [Crossiella sp. SN42]|uniref:MFS transporter n=1 Tax=Crossiella sp. SN42 TaxID=2944808 RepID=UPI00207D42D1|nr:MFS transporter [Crossiella sp. SN42]MCO1581041.1 MFS transporter [Crossiella sp. SN42]
MSQAEPVLIRSARDVTDLVNSGAARGSHATMIVIIALGGIFIDAYDFSSLAYGMRDIAAQFGLSPVGAGVVNASIMVGAVVGALGGGYLVDKIGRYRVFMADMLFFVVAALGCALAPSAEVLVLFRFLMGVGVGMDLPVAMAFLAEFSRLRGKGSKGSRTASWSAAWFVATSACYLIILGLYFLIPAENHGVLWRFTVGFGAVPALVVLLVRHRYMNESPAWAAGQGDLEGAAAILRRSYGVNAVVAPEATVVTAPKRSVRAEFGRLFNRTYRRRTWLSLAVALAQTFGYNAVAYGLPVIIAGFLAQGPLTTISASLVLNVCFAVTGGLLGIRWVRSRGAWQLTALGFAVQLAALVALALIGRPSGPELAVAALLALGAFLFAQGWGPGANYMTFATLSYPTSLRGMGVGFNQGMLRIGSTVSLFLFPVLSASLGTGVFWVIALAPALGLLALLLVRWEPVGYDVDAEDAEGVPVEEAETRR